MVLSLSSFMFRQEAESCANRHVFLTSMLLLCSCSHTCHFRDFGIVILWPLSPSVMAMSSHNA